MKLQIYGTDGMPEPIMRGHAMCGLIQMVQFAFFFGGAIALLVADPSRRWVGFVLGGGLLALEAAGWVVGSRAMRRAPEYTGRGLAPAALGSPERRIVGAMFLSTVPVGAYIIATLELDSGTIAFIGAVLAVCECAILRMWIRRSWLGGSWLPFAKPAEAPTEPLPPPS